jgi:hypothetical protein
MPADADLLDAEPIEDDDNDEPVARLDWTLTIEREQRSLFELKRLFDRKDLVVNPAFQRTDV